MLLETWRIVCAEAALKTESYFVCKPHRAGIVLASWGTHPFAAHRGYHFHSSARRRVAVRQDATCPDSATSTPTSQNTPSKLYYYYKIKPCKRKTYVFIIFYSRTLLISHAFRNNFLCIIRGFNNNEEMSHKIHGRFPHYYWSPWWCKENCCETYLSLQKIKTWTKTYPALKYLNNWFKPVYRIFKIYFN